MATDNQFRLDRPALSPLNHTSSRLLLQFALHPSSTFAIVCLARTSSTRASLPSSMHRLFVLRRTLLRSAAVCASRAANTSPPSSLVASLAAAGSFTAALASFSSIPGCPMAEFKAHRVVPDVLDSWPPHTMDVRRRSKHTASLPAHTALSSPRPVNTHCAFGNRRAPYCARWSTIPRLACTLPACTSTYTARRTSPSECGGRTTPDCSTTTLVSSGS